MHKAMKGRKNLLEYISCANGGKRKTLLLLVLCVLTILFSACSDKLEVRLPVLEDYEVDAAGFAKTNLKLGVVSGPYGDMFADVIQPLLSKKGYHVELVVYNNYNDPNFALAAGEIDLNMFQHYVYLNDFKFENDLSLSAIAEIPTASMGIYSMKHHSLDDLAEGMTVAIPSDSTNLSRALAVLNAAGIISLDPAVDSMRVSLQDVQKNPHNIKFLPLDAHALVSAMRIYDLAVINGNYAINGGLSMSDALFCEPLAHGYINIIAVKTDDLGEPFVLDLIDVLRSDEFKSFITDTEGRYSGFQYPCNFLSFSLF